MPTMNTIQNHDTLRSSRYRDSDGWFDHTQQLDFEAFVHELIAAHPTKSRFAVLGALKLSRKALSPDAGLEALKSRVAGLLSLLP